MSNINQKIIDDLKLKHNIRNLTIKRVFFEHPLSLILFKAGYKRKDLPKAAGISRHTWDKQIKDPVKYWKLGNYEKLAKYLGIDLYEFIEFVRTKKKSKAWWFEV